MNLLKNPNFDEGHHHQNQITEMVVPDHWHIYWLDGEKFKHGGDQPAYRPESAVWNIQNAPPHEKSLFFLKGNYCWKVFKASAPVYFAVKQDVSGLMPGAKYRFNAQVYPDIVTGYSGGKKVRPGDIWSAESRAGWSDPSTPWPHAEDGDVNWSEWFNIHNGNYAFGEYNDIWVEFVAPISGEVTVWVENKGKWGFENNWFMDAFSLEMIESAPSDLPSPGPPPSEPPTPPEPSPEPTTGRGAPRKQYARTYFLLPKTLPLDMALAAMRVAHEAHVTVGFSPDDAGIGDLDRRLVVCVNPEQFDLPVNQGWYDSYYPGVKFMPIKSVSTADELAAKLRALF